MSARMVPATLDPRASQLVQRLLSHMDGMPAEAGCQVILTRWTPAGLTVELFGINAPTEGMQGGARLLCEHAAGRLRVCTCGADHSGTIMALEQAALLLMDDPHAPKVRQ